MTDGMQRVGDALKDTTGIKWTVCPECAFEYPSITDRCPQCNPPPPVVPVRRGWVREAEPMEDEEVLAVMEGRGVNVRAFGAATLDTFNPDPDGYAIDLAKRWIEEWEATADRRWPYRDWMYLYGYGSTLQGGRLSIGKLGNGKTHLGIAMAREVLRRRLVRPDSYAFITAEAMLLEMEATFRSKSEDSEFRLLEKYERLDLLHIDDFGVRAPSEHAIRILDELTKRREGKATIWTSNLSLKVVAQQHTSLQRIVSRIAGSCGEGAMYAIAFRGEDRRLERSKRGRV
jgi:hypothetical protein